MSESVSNEFQVSIQVIRKFTVSVQAIEFLHIEASSPLLIGQIIRIYDFHSKCPRVKSCVQSQYNFSILLHQIT